jgi:pantetheine-phosphate adenylyltransferase
MKKAMFAFSADPIHNGHIKAIEKASKMCDELIVGVGINHVKNYLFSLNERVDMVKKSLKHIKNVKVIGFSGLLVDYAYENNINTIIKFVRNQQDVDYEKALTIAGKTQGLGITTKMLKSPDYISSTLVKNLVKEQGFVHELVPLFVKQKLEAKISDQCIIGITGLPGSGKSYLCEKFKEIGKKNKIKVHNIEFDHIGHYILSNSKEEMYVKIRKEIAETFGKELIQKDGSIDRKNLSLIVFNDKNKLKQLNKIMAKPLEVRLRRELYGKKGLILFNAAIIAENNLGFICNNNIILINSNKSKERLLKCGLSLERVNAQLKSQLSFEGKKQKLQGQIKKDNYGKLWIFYNNNSNNKIKTLFENITTNI